VVTDVVWRVRNDRRAARSAAVNAENRPRTQEGETAGSADARSERAAETFAPVLERSPDQLRSLRRDARLLMQRSDFDAARLRWESLRRLVPDDVEANLSLARLHQRAKERMEAIALAAAVLRVDPQHAEATRLRTTLADAELEELTARISPDNAAELAPRVAELEAAIGDHPVLRRIKTVAPRAEKPAAVAHASDRAESDDAGPDKRFRRIDRAAGAGRHEDFLSGAEDLFATAGAEPETAALLDRHRDLLRSLADGGDPSLAWRAGRLLRLAPKKAMPPSPRVESDGADGFAPPEEADSLAGALDKLETLASYADDAAIGSGLRQTFSTLLARVEAERSALPADEADALEAGLDRLARQHPGFAQAAARFHADKGDLSRALGTFRRLETPDAAPQVWLDAAKLASAANDTTALLEFCGRIGSGASTPSLRKRAAELLTAHQLHDAAIATWRAAETEDLDLRVRLGVVRALDADDRTAELFDEAVRTLADASPYERLGSQDQIHLVEIVRRLFQAAIRAELGERLAAPLAAVAERNPGSALAAWIIGLLESARFDHGGALRHLQDGLGLPPIPAEVPVDLNAEIAVLHARFHLFGEASAAVRTLSSGLLDAHGHYRRQLDLLEPVIALCGEREALRYPECLIDVIWRRSRPIRSATIPGRATSSRSRTLSARVAGNARPSRSWNG
jgi:hypothetical protein